MKEILLSKGFAAIIDDDDFERVSKFKWYTRSNGGSKFYAATGTPGDSNKKIYLHRFILEAPSNLQVDHINGNTMDNRKENLRLCTIQENLRNKKASGQYKGAIYAGKGRDLAKPWSARISHEGKNLYLGYYATAEEAAKAYDKAAKELYGEFAQLNFKEKE